MGAARAHVITQLRALRTADQDRKPADRAHRTLSLGTFEDLCDKARTATGAPLSNPEAFLETLHHAGLVYRREGTFDGQLVLDQTWALDAIYAVFDRTSQCAQAIVASEGRFTPRLLAKTVWRDTHYTKADRTAFLRMMVDSRVCFRLDGDSTRRVLEATSDREVPSTSDPETARYLAPELLPPFETSSVVLRGLWDEAVTTEVRVLSLAFFGPHLGRLVLSRLGQEVQDHGHYWKFGLFFFDARTQSQALVKCLAHSDEPGDHGGRIEVRAQLGRAGELADQVLAILEDALERAGEVGWCREDAPPTPHRARDRILDDDARPPPLTPGRAPNDPVRVYLSYRHTPRSRAVAESVEAALATMPHVEVHRDVRDLRPGDDLRRYAVDIARADYVVAVVSRRYFDSEHCMRELLFFERDGCADEPEAFRRKLIPVVVEPCPEHDEGIDPTDGTLVTAIRELWAAQLAVQAPESLAEEEFGAIKRRVGPWLDRIGRTVTIRDTAEEEGAGWPEVRAWVAR